MARYNVDLQDNEGNAYQIMANPDSVAEFSPAANRENIRSGETYRVIFGKIMKYLSEVGNAAYVGLANNCTTTIAGFALDARQGKELMDRINELNRDLDGFSFHSGDDGHYLQKGDEMYLLKNKPLEISSWYYQANGGKTEFILDSSEYKKLSIGQVNGNGGTMSVLGITSSTIPLSKETDGYYDVTAYDQIMIRISASSYVQGTVNNIRLW